jgi:hypothetical protein
MACPQTLLLHSGPTGPLRITRHVSSLAGAVINAPKIHKQLQKGKELTQAFLAVVEAEGGQLGGRP